MKWKYGTMTISGNLHTASSWLNENHPEWDILQIDVVGFYSIIFYRIQIN